MTDFAQLDATAQAALVRRGEVTPLELVDAAIARIERLNPTLNAVIIPLFEKARIAAAGRLPDGPFRGVPFLVKDLVCHTAGDPFHAGMQFLRQVGWTARHDTYLAEKLRQAGFVFVGRTNTPELGAVPTTEPAAYGATRNPWDIERSPGGSSGGAGAAVASGMVAVAHGNDGGGSIRVPSSACGLVGLKPTRGRVSLGPDLGDTWAGAAIEHVLTRTVRDTAGVLDVIHGAMPGDPYTAPPPARPFADEVGAAPGRLRVGVMSRAPAGAVDVQPDCVAAVRDAARLLASLGHDVVETHPAALDETDTAPFFAVVASWVRHDLDFWSAQTGHPITAADVEPYTWAVAEMGRALSAPAYIDAVVWLQAYTRRVAEWWATGFDLLLTPTMAAPPPLLGEISSPPEEPLRGLERMTPFVIFTAPFNITGQPAISLPLCWNDAGLPIGLQLVAAYGREDVLLRVAAQLEAARPWADRRPPVHA